MPVNPSSVLFVCGGLEPGRDGVGDYTRLLAAELQRHGVRVGLLAWRDPHVHAARVESTAEGAPILRVPLQGFGPGDLALVRSLVNRVEPEVLSLQYVPYAYDHHGMPVRFPAALKEALPRLPWHLMVHEPWSDGGRGGFFRRLAIREIQRWCMLRVWRILRPVSVHTSNARYAALLASSGMRAEILPLYGNIPVTGARDFGAFSRLLGASGAEEAAPGQVPLVVGVFGTLHPEWEPEPLAADLAAAARTAGRPLRLVGVGGFGPAGERLWARLERALGVRGVLFGRRSEAEVSFILANLDIAFATTPWELIGKSGSTAALIEHGVPVVVTRGTGKREPDAHGLHFFFGNWGERWLEVVADRPAKGSRLPLIVGGFLASLAAGLDRSKGRR